jgi:2-succinyl-5-enolpyruvyl-6-hydroxy-3-cyclohexene-1-carboxylate synthase
MTNPIGPFVRAFVEEICKTGRLFNAVICPGSRSTPLALAFADIAAMDKQFHLWMHVDERAAAFFALGIAKRSSCPVALVCTSGTAAANFFPAIVEANLSHVPLVVITADRPPELRDNGAPQTIDQVHLYGRHVKWYAEAALPEATPAAIREIRILADRAVATAHANPQGPVHINMPFREPLMPDDDGAEIPLEHAFISASSQVYLGSLQTDDRHLSMTAREIALPQFIRPGARGIIVLGPSSSLEDALPEAALQLAEKLRWPILADPLSQARGIQDPNGMILTSYDAYLRDTDFIASMPIETVVRFDAMPTSKSLSLYLQQHPQAMQIVVNAQGDWSDPTQLASLMIHADPSAVCEDLVEALAFNSGETVPAWCSRWQHAEQVTRAALRQGVTAFDGPFEGRVFTELAEWLPEKTTLVVGNSMPIRDADTFFWPNQNIFVYGNRGANGIDGIVSTALGISASQISAKPKRYSTVLVIGDLSFYHDLNGLLAAKMHHLSLTIVLINNDGGGIFSFLPQADRPEHFEQLFGTPTGLDFCPIVEAYGGHFHRPENWADFRVAVETGMAEGGLHVVEVRTDRARNVAQHRELWQAVSTALQELPE